MTPGRTSTQVETADAAATEALGRSVGELLRPGDVVLLAGELGAGKTTFVRGACRALGVDGPITSPTFAIANRYAAADGLEVAHLDLYRLATLDDEDPGLLDDYLGGDRVAFVEWPPTDRAAFGPIRMCVTLTHLGGDRRRVELRG
jgi:tRNA threonylcarbamoyladenosine biosynthesis protein TsaE